MKMDILSLIFQFMMQKEQDLKKLSSLSEGSTKKTLERVVGDRVSKFMEVEYVYQELENLPEGFSVPEGRTKPFGTGHAILSRKDVVDGPFAVINADDYYGKERFQGCS